MFKGFILYYILSALTHSPLLALFLLFVLYAVADRAYLGFLPDISAPLKRNGNIRALRAELALNPANAAAAQELGTLYFEKKNYSRALEYLSLAAEKIHNSARLYLFLGMVYMELNRPEKGKAALDRVLELDSRVGYGLPYIYLIQFELKQDKANEAAIKKLETDLERYAGTENFYRLGMVYKKHGYRQRAKEMFRRAISEYAYVPKGMRRLHRKWAILARLS